MTQLTDKIREAIIGNVGTVISGRIGITDAEILVKKFEPTFTADDMTKMPNFQGIASVMINNTPSAPFSISFTPPLAKSDEALAVRMKKLSAIKYGRPRIEVESEIRRRISTPVKVQQSKRFSPANSANAGNFNPSYGAKPGQSGPTSFLDEWLSKRQKSGSSRPGVIKTPTYNSSQYIPQSNTPIEYNAQKSLYVSPNYNNNPQTYQSPQGQSQQVYPTVNQNNNLVNSQDNNGDGILRLR